MKQFLISIDTEGDDLWSWKIGDKVTTENAKFLPRFQAMCEEYGFKPTYLTNYEMASDDFFAKTFGAKAQNGLCEIGMHLHAWNCPPYHELGVRTDCKPGAPYLIEYPDEVMDKKVEFMTNLIAENFGSKPITHRSGRWAMDDRYFALLEKYGYLCDCSVTPSMSWVRAAGQCEGSFGSDYTNFPHTPYKVENTGIIEVPVTVKENHCLHLGKDAGLRKSIKKHIEAKKGYGPMWLRPRMTSHNLEDLLWLTDSVAADKNSDYLMFMLHSSEFMPGGSPTFRTEEDVEYLYKNLEVLFSAVSKKFKGTTISDYTKQIKDKI